MEFLGWILFSVLIVILLTRIIYKRLTIYRAHHYNERVAYFRELNKELKPNGIVFLGDSITEQFLVSEFFPEHNVVNRGISGDTTDGVLGRMNESVFDLSPSKIFLLIGTNDLGYGNKPFYIINNIEAIVRKVLDQLPKIEIYLLSVYPVRKEGEKRIGKTIVGKRNNEDIDAINKGIKEISERYNLTYIDINSRLKDASGMIKKEYTTEGLHITPSGYRIVVDELKKFL